MSPELKAKNDRIEELERALAHAETRLALETAERKFTESALRSSLKKSETLHRIVSDSSSVVFSWLAEDGWPVAFVSDNIHQYGYSPDDFYSGRIRYADIIHPDDLPRIMKEVARNSQASQVLSFIQEYRIITADEQTIWVDDRTWIIRNAQGEITCYEGIIVDISKRKKTEEELRQSQEKLQSVIDNIPQFIMWKDQNSVYLGCNRLFAEAAGLKHPGQIIGKRDTELPWTQEETAWYLSCDRRVMASDTSEIHIAETLLRADGKKIWLDTCKIPLHDSEGNVTGILGTIEDITERKQAEEELQKHRDYLEELVNNRTAELAYAKKQAEKAEKISRKQRDFLDSMMETLPNPVFFKDTDGIYQSFNPAFEKFLGKQRHEILGKTVFDLAPQELAERYHHKDNELFENPGTQHYTWQVIHADGTVRDVIFDKATIHNEESGIIGLIGIISDISGLVEARRQAEVASRIKSEFLANMSHEIRTPLNGVIGMIKLLLETQLSSSQREYAETVEASADMLLSVINDILDFSKIEANKLQIEEIDFDLYLVIDEVNKVISYQAQEKGLLFLVYIDQNIPANLTGDPVRLKQVLLNLACNAIKFTDTGEVRIRVEAESQTEDSAHLRFSVSDTGIGIPSEQIHHLFESFTQLDGSHSRKYGGSGLGLAICKKLVEMMDGQIGLESQEGQGATFWFSMVLKKQTKVMGVNPLAQKNEEKQTKAGNSGGGRILLVEDNNINQIVTLHILTKLGYDAIAVDNGYLALEKLAVEHFDLIFMDIQMPEMDGYEATRAIRSEQQLAQGIPIIAMTAHAMAGDREKCLAAGMNDHISKPVDPETLTAKLREWLD